LQFINVVLVFLGLLSFLNSAAAKGQADLESVTLRLKYQHNFQFAGYYAAKLKGYYQDAGLDVTILPSTPDSSTSQAVLSGVANYGIGTSSLILKHAKGQPLVTLAVIFQHSPYVLLTDKHTTLTEIAGKQTAIYQGAHDLVAMLARQGVHTDDYHNDQQGYAILDFIESKIAAVSSFSPNEPYVLQHIRVKHNTYTPRDYGVNFYGDNIFTSRHELEQHGERTQRFIDASIRGWEYAIAHPQELARLLVSHYQSQESLEQILFSAKEIADLVQPQLLAIGSFNEQRWRHIADIYAELGLLPQQYDFSDFLHQPKSESPSFWIYLVLFILSVFAVFLLLYRVYTLVRSQRKAAHEMRFMNSILRTQQQASIDGIMTFDANGQLVSSNKQLIHLWNLKQSQLENKHSRKIVFQMIRQLKDPKELISVMRQHDKNQHMQSFAEMSLKDGRTFERFSAPLFHDDKSFLGRFWSFRDITERKVAEEQIWFKANFDSLTELPNRFMFKERLLFEIKKVHRSNKLLALLFLDIDRFKEVNDSMGHDVGDQLLVQVAKRLKHCVRDIDMVSRLGGDEFTVILNDLEQADDVKRVAQSILDAIARPFIIEHQTIYISTSIGITISPEDGDDDIELLKRADLSMYHAKMLGRNNYQFFTSSLQVGSVEKMALSNDLRQALANDELFIVYQPIVCLKSKNIIKAEALLRWKHPQRGLINPEDFIPIAEETGLINEIGEWIFQQAVEQVKRCRRFAPNFQISINTSPVQYHSGSIDPNAWHEYLMQQQVCDSAVIIELTETLLLESDSALLATLAQFKHHGIKVALDDFGTGYSSLSYLQKFDIDYLKIDRSFVSELTSGSKNAALCQAIIAMANALGMKVVAEGIEKQEHNRLLTELGCDYGQGYLFSKPIAENALTDMLAEKKLSTVI